MKVKVGAAFNLVMQQALRLLHLIQRLAQQLLTAVCRLFRRGEDATTPSELAPSLGNPVSSTINACGSTNSNAQPADRRRTST